jgi:hypothetical protein
MKVFAFVLVATILEASSDAVIRLSLHSHSMAGRGGDTTSIKAHRACNGNRLFTLILSRSFLPEHPHTIIV